MFPDSQYKVILSLPGRKEESYTYTRKSSELPVTVGEQINVGGTDGGGRRVTVTEIAVEPIPGKKIGELHARLPKS